MQGILDRLNRRLRTLCQCTSTFLQVESEQELLQSLCEILVAGGDCRLAWIGYCEDDADKTIRPVAQAGSGLEYGVTALRARAEHKRSAEALHQAREELARVTRVTTLGELAASIAHEVNQPLAAIVADANACLHWLDADPPPFDSIREALAGV